MAASVSLKDLGLTSEVMAYVLKKEKNLGLRLESIWFADSRDKKEFLYGKFIGKKKSDEVIVTLAQRFPNKTLSVMEEPVKIDSQELKCRK